VAGKGAIASGTVSFRAATAATQAALPALKTDPSAVAIGTATSANTLPIAWSYDPCTAAPCALTTAAPTPVSADLKAAGQDSQAWLRVWMTFGSGATLTEWAQLYDCIPAE
jgi:hypothetical protein